MMMAFLEGVVVGLEVADDLAEVRALCSIGEPASPHQVGQWRRAIGRDGQPQPFRHHPKRYPEHRLVRVRLQFRNNLIEN